MRIAQAIRDHKSFGRTCSIIFSHPHRKVRTMTGTRIQKIKTHVQENKKVYIGTGVGILVGSVVTLTATRKTVIIVDSLKLINWKSPHTSQIILPALGDPGNVVQCLETGSIYASQGQAARELGVAPQAVSAHLKGAMPDLKGKHYKRIGKAGHPLAE